MLIYMKLPREAPALITTSKRTHNMITKKKLVSELWSFLRPQSLPIMWSIRWNYPLRLQPILWCANGPDTKKPHHCESQIPFSLVERWPVCVLTNEVRNTSLKKTRSTNPLGHKRQSTKQKLRFAWQKLRSKNECKEVQIEHKGPHNKDNRNACLSSSAESRVLWLRPRSAVWGGGGEPLLGEVDKLRPSSWSETLRTL